MYYSGNGIDKWKTSSDGSTLCQESDVKQYNCIAMTDYLMEAGKDYTLEVKARFFEAWTAGSTWPADEGGGVGLIYGSATQQPWTTNPRTYLCTQINRNANKLNTF